METEHLEDLLEIHLQGSWIEVNKWIWRSWAGPRRLNGQPYDGPVYFLGSEAKVSAKPSRGRIY